ncbi:MAG: M56 family metallopeptidase [Microbacterium sp.]
MTPVAIAQGELGEALIVPHPTIVVAAILLGVVALALAVPVPIALSRAGWPMRMPVMALLLWQAIGLTGGLTMIGGLWLAGLSLAPRHPLLVAIPALVFALYLLAQLGVTIVQVNRQRHRHLALLDLLTSPHPTRARTRVLEDAVPVAYCLPRGAGSVTVLSRGLLERLDADELAAVIAHERAHVEQRHDLLLLVFRAWRRALPWFPTAQRAEAEVAALVEMLADDHARREVHDEVLARAILHVGATGAPTAAPVACPVACPAACPEPVEGPVEGAAGSTRMHDRFRRLVPTA